MVRGTALSRIQETQDALVDRFCSVKRRLPWVGEEIDFAELEDPVRQEILFYETRGYYLFQEPWLEHQPVNNRYRVVLVFRPTEANR